MRKKETKEIRKKRKEMELVIWKKMSPEEKEQEITARKEKSTSDFKKNKEKETARKKMIREGKLFLHKNQCRTFAWTFARHKIFAGALLKTGSNNIPYYLVTYTICSPRDMFSTRTAEGTVGARLKSEDHPYKFEIMLAKRGALTDKRLNALCYAHILMDIVAKRTKAPNKLEQFCLRYLAALNEVKR